MDAKLNRISLLWGVPGLIIQTVGYLASGWSANPKLAWLGLLVTLAGTGLLLVGLGYYARAKGHSPVWGLAGLLSCIGILVLAVLPDKNIEPDPSIMSIDELDLPDGTQPPPERIDPK